MFKSLPLFIGLRYILAKKDNRYISFTSLISMAGLTLGVLSIIVVLSVFNGSQGIMRERTLITVPHGNIASTGNFNDWPAALEEMKTYADIIGAAPYIGIEAMLSQQGYHQVTAIKAIAPDEESSVSTISENMVQGRLDDLVSGQNGIILGRTLADNMRLNRGDSVNLLVPAVSANNSVSLGMHRFTVVGIFDPRFTIGSDLALIHLEDSLPLLGSNNLSEYIQLRLRVNDLNRADEIVEDAVTGLTQSFPDNEFVGTDWSVTEASLFNALKLEKVMTWFMLMMIVAIGAFNIISTLVMVVSEKKADIAILRTMGAGAGTVMGIFVVQGTMVGVIGTCIGALAGVTLAVNFSALSSSLEAVLSPSSLFLISSLPSSLQASDVWITCIAALSISFMATLYPALKASQVLPAEVLRYE
ncbi:lipoprotein-releasing ABC transporter permease subunit [bacterium]|jgi:lipoprotein-releasing system permease protein|nr:lipoprotein-releasing ABC transporter permease subunit [bacterium]